jgi:hypothetical protein
VLIVSLLSEAIHVVPIERAAGRCGALYSSADATRGDAFRVAALVRHLRPAAVVGVNAEVLAGLAELGHQPAEVLGAVDAVATADAAAHATLAAAGPRPRRWVKLGPTSAWEGDTPGVVAYDPARWEADAADGEIVLTNRAPRLTACAGLATGVRGRVVEPGLIELAGET